MKGADRRAKIECDESGMKLTFGFGTFRVSCQGRFSGIVKCERKAIQDFLRSWKVRQATSYVEQCDGELRIDETAIACSLDGEVAQSIAVDIETPTVATAKKPISMLALLAESKSNRNSDLDEIYAVAQKKARLLIAQAADVLSPLEITREDIQLLVDRKIKESMT